MADNTQLNAGSGGDTIRNKDRSGIKTQVVALDLNPAGTESLMAGVMPVAKATAVEPSYGEGTNQPLSQDLTGHLRTAAVLLDAFENGLTSTNSALDVNVKSIVTGAAALGKAEDAAHVSGDTGVMVLGVRQTSPTDLSANTADGDYEPVQLNSRGGLWVAGQAGPRGGWDQATGSIGATKTDIGTANIRGHVGGWFIYNPNTSTVYVQFFNAQASAVTLGTTAPVYSLGIPPSSAANIAPGMVGLEHVTAISIAITTTRAGLTGPASTVDYNIWFKQ